MAFYQEIRYCIVPNPASLGDGICQNFGKYNTAGCGFDNGDCVEFNKKFPDCEAMYPILLENDRCDGGEYNTQECGWDGGYCDSFNTEYPNCNVEKPILVGNGVCEGGSYNTAECGWDGKDCLDFWEKYPNCTVDYQPWIGDSFCDGGKYNTPECNYDDGDCNSFNSKFPNCTVDYPILMGDGHCDDFGEYNTDACEWDGDDCEQYNPSSLPSSVPSTYPSNTPSSMPSSMPSAVPSTFPSSTPSNAPSSMPSAVPSTYDASSMPSSSVPSPYPSSALSSTLSEGPSSIFFPGPPLPTSYSPTPQPTFSPPPPKFMVPTASPSKSLPPNLVPPSPAASVPPTSALTYPNCTVDYQSFIGNGRCNGGEYNTLECGFDGGDCKEFNSKYSNCFGVKLLELGDGICQHNTPDCDYDDGDCFDFNTLYPNCTADKPYLVGDGDCNDDYNIPECQFDGGDCINEEQIIAVSYAFVNGDLVSIKTYRNDTQAYATIQTVSSVISLIASIGIIWIICRTFKKLSVPFHRLLLGLCVADVISSSAQSFSTLPAPNSFDVIWNANGSKGLCRAQGFFIFLGSVAAPLYNCSMCIYYLIVVTYRKGKNADAYIEGKIEFCLHAVPIVVSLVGATTILSMDAFNPNMTYCYIGADPTCDDLECDKRNANAKVLFIVFSAGPYMILPCVIFSTMTIMYRAVLAQEKKLQRFGVGALALRVKNRNKNSNGGGVEGNDNNATKEKKINSRNPFVRMKSWIASRRSSKNKIIRSNSAGKQSRAVMNKALSYSLAFFFTYLFPIIISIRTLIGLESGPALSILARVFFPLQGFFNFLVFIHPKVVHIKKSSREDISWYGAYVKAIQSRGRPINNGGTKVRSSSAGNRSSTVSAIIGWIAKKTRNSKEGGIMTKEAQIEGNNSNKQKSKYIIIAHVDNEAAEEKEEEKEIVGPLRSKRTSQTGSSNYASNHAGFEIEASRVSVAAEKSSDDIESSLLSQK